MKMKVFSAAVLALMMTACGQKALQDPASTVVNADGTVTFNYRNDNAKDVKVDVQFAGRHDMVKDSVSGVWSLTLGPAEADMYPYCFVVDGVSIMDPQCDQFFPNEGFKNSLLDIPGTKEPLVHSIQNVPHGNVEYISYYSEAIGGYNNALVYLPPSYDKSNDSYPVFYLISGTTDTEEVYYKVGRMNYILDNLVAKGEAKEMIIVLPYGNPMKIMPKQPAAGPEMFFRDFFGEDLIGSLMPYVENHYRTINDRDNRAIGGFSRGGNQGLMNGLMHLDKFSYICGYSTFTQTNLPNVYDNAEDTNSKLHLFWSGVGTDDFLYGTARDYTEFLDKKGITCVKEYTHDKFGHTWMNAKYFLAMTMKLLFNPEASAEAMKNAQPTLAKTGEEQDFTPGVMARLFPKPLISPEFVGDSVIFRTKAPEAKVVKLEGDMLEKPLAMEKDTDGVWSVAVANLEPSVYCYNFDVDGLKVMDAQNMYLVPERGFKRSILDMPNDTYAVNAKQCEYTAVRVIADKGNYAEIVPMGKTKETMPIVNLVADDNDTYEGWFKVAKVGIVLDQMIADGECKPCRVFISEKEVAGSQVTIHSGKCKSWGDARKEFVKAVKAL
ncbi:MAG: hypothetical protein MJZ18_10155 [Bacteroidales bacterium]|nr:hypothetical protein [Bacteroidales bacterium]